MLIKDVITIYTVQPYQSTLKEKSIVKIHDFGPDYGEKIEKFDSDFIFSKIIRLNAEAKVSCFYLDPNGIVGYHQAVTAQLFLVVRGNGWVRDETSGRIPIGQYQAAFWDKDEWHEAGTDTGLVAIVIEGESLNTSEYMPIHHWRSIT